MERRIKTCSNYYCRKRLSYVCCDGCDEADSCEYVCGKNADECRYASPRVNECEIKCPFFDGENLNRSEAERRRFGCESFIGRTAEKVEFESYADKIRFMALYCCADWQSCPRAQELTKKYEG